VLTGSIYLNEKIASRLISRMMTNAASVTASPAESLADREFQVFELIGRGLNTHDIAHQLHIAVKTVETYRARIKQKLSLKDASELLQLAIACSRSQ
jgi:DNA-binding NarL/FixJ family response regulator